MSFPEINLIAELRREHQIVDDVAGSLYHWALRGQKDDPEALGIFVEFIKTWVQGFHHQREEEILFPALIDELSLKPDNGPIRVLVEEHSHEKELVRKLEKAAPGEDRVNAARELARFLWEHVDKENSVVFAEGNERLVRSGIRQLPMTEASDGQKEALKKMLALIGTWEPWDDEDHIRGDGCMGCPAYGDQCSGIEIEWWNQWEWERHDSYQG